VESVTFLVVIVITANISPDIMMMILACLTPGRNH